MVKYEEMVSILREFQESIFHSLDLNLENFLKKRALYVKHSKFDTVTGFLVFEESCPIDPMVTNHVIELLRVDKSDQLK